MIPDITFTVPGWLSTVVAGMVIFAIVFVVVFNLTAGPQLDAGRRRRGDK